MRTRIVRSVAREELREVLADGRLRWALLVFVGLLLVAIVSGGRRYAQARAAHAATLQASYQQFQHQSPKNPHAGAHFGVNALRPVPALSLFDRGVDDHLGTDIFLEPHKPNLFANAPILDSIGAARLGQVGGAEAALFLLPLLVVMLAAPSITRERERGTLQLLLAQGVRGLEVASGKALGLAVVMALALAVPLLALCAVTVLLGDSASLDAVRVSMLLAAYGASVVVFLLLSIAISALVARTRSALLLALALWASVVLVAPRMLDQIVRAAAPTPTAVELKSALEADPREPLDLLARTSDADRMQALLAKYGVATPEQLPVNPAGVLLEDSEVRGNRVYDRHFEALFDRYREQQRLTGRWSVFSPASAVTLVSASASGTDLEHRLDWWRSAETHRRRMNTILNEYFATHSTAKQSFGFVVGSEAWSLVPAWSYVHRPGTWALGHEVAALGSLAFWCAAALLGFVAAARRMRAV